MEKIDFTIMKLERITNEICSIAPHDIKKQPNILLAENMASAGIVLAKCKEYVNTADNLSQSGSSMSAVDEFFDNAPIFEKTISKVQSVQTISSIQEFQAGPQMLVVANVNVTQRKLNHTHYKLKPNLNKNWSYWDKETK